MDLLRRLDGRTIRAFCGAVLDGLGGDDAAELAALMTADRWTDAMAAAIAHAAAALSVVDQAVESPAKDEPAVFGK